MSRRNPPVALVGSVHVLAPTGASPYYRLTWTDPDGRAGRTSGGRTLEGATGKAHAIDANLSRAAGPASLTTLGQIVEEYVATGRGRHQKTHQDWSPTQLQQTRRILRRCVRGFEHVPALDLDRPLADRMRAQGGTRNTVKANTSALRGLLRWGQIHGYFSPAQAEMLPPGAAEVAPALTGTSAPRRHSSARHVGQAEGYIADEDAPSVEQVVRLGDVLQARFPAWGKLAVELAASVGPRWGEQFQLTAHDLISGKGGKPMLRIHHQINSAAKVTLGEDRRKLPKGEKIREAGVSAISCTGYRLLEELHRRCTQALREQAAGTNPEALLFPADRGGMLHHSGFSADQFHPAAMAAGWPAQRWSETHQRYQRQSNSYVLETRERVQFDLTWHSLRHRYARYAIDTLGLSEGQLMAHGGWESSAIVSARYYDSGLEHRDSGLEKF